MLKYVEGVNDSFLSSSPSRAGVEGCPDTHASVRTRIETPPVS
jgi:hypothetical protein